MASSEDALFYDHSELHRCSYSRLGSDWYVDAQTNCVVIQLSIPLQVPTERIFLSLTLLVFPTATIQHASRSERACLAAS
jgi:hypothetical protein